MAMHASIARRCFNLLTSIGLVGVSAAHTVAVHSAPLASTLITFGISVSKPSGAICVGVDVPVTVTITKINTYLDTLDRPVGFIAPGMDAVPIEGFVTDPAIGTLTPARLITGWAMGYDARGATTFNFHATKVGSTQIFFESSPEGGYLDAKEPMTVVNCKYKVSILANLSGGCTACSMVAIGRAEGLMEADASGNLKGTASMEWDVHAFSACNTHVVVVSGAPDVNLTGTVSGDDGSISLQAAFDPVSMTDSSRTCPIPYVGVVSGSASATGELTPIDVHFPATGGSTATATSITWGAASPKGAAVITVTPVEAR